MKLDQLTAIKLNDSVIQFNYTVDGKVRETANIMLYEGAIVDVRYIDPMGTIHVLGKPKETRIIGDANTKRKVEHYLTPNIKTVMRLGLTTHIGNGTWSSLPHHFELNPERGFEEVFYYMLYGKTEDDVQRAIQIKRGMLHNCIEIDTIEHVTPNTFSIIPMGYHAVCAEPGVNLSYVWCYLAKYPRWEKL